MNPLPLLTPFDPATMIESLDERGSGLRVVFFKPESAADRYGHLVATVEHGGQPGESVVARLVSYEGNGRDGWPMSPPLQSLSIERRPAGAVALLVGMSGQSHWSASFEALAGRRLEIDIACRLGMVAAGWRLASTYLVDGGLTASSSRVALDWGTDAKFLIEFGPETEATMTTESVVLAVRTTTQRPIRWKYRVYCG